MNKLKNRLNTNTLIISLVVLILICILIGVPFYFYRQKQNQVAANIANPQKDLSESEIQGLVRRVSRHVQLPEKEKPTIATVSDVQRLKNQSFFLNAQNGDKVLIFMQSKKAYLYRPNTDRVIDIAPVNLPTPTPQNAPEVASANVKAKQLSVVIYNGSGSTSLLRTLEKKLEEISDIEVVETASAAKQYKTTTVVDLTGDNASLAASIATKISGTVGQLPKSEERPEDADMLIILGSSLIKN